MEKFTVQIKGVYSDKTRNISVEAEDHILAHKNTCYYYNEIREDIISIKDSKKNEVYNLSKGFIFE